jgi:tetratricopeptide (TPR) repeat protein
VDKELSRAIQLDPTDALAHYYLGLTYYNLQRYEEALAAYSRAIQLDPTLAQVYYDIGAVLGNHGEFREALPYFEKAAQLGYPDGAKYVTQARQRLAIEVLREASSIDEMQHTTAEFPFMSEADFIAAIERFVARQIPLEQKPTFEQRLAWLRQIAKERNQ